MSSLQFELKGLEKLQSKLQRVAKMEEVEHIVEKHGEAMQKKQLTTLPDSEVIMKVEEKINISSSLQGRQNVLFLSIVVRSVGSNIKLLQALAMLLTLN